jgi:hypothetical protein
MADLLKPMGIENGLFLYDDYLVDSACITSEISFPSVRHVVLSSKTNDPQIKKKIAETKLPADLKDLELSIQTPDYWTAEYIYQKMFYWTLYKFKKNKEFGEKLKAIDPSSLQETAKHHYGIKELVDNFPNYRVEILIEVRKKILS